MTPHEPYTTDDERIRRTREKMRDAEDRLLALRDELNDNIAQRRAAMTGDEWLCPVCGRVVGLTEWGWIEPHESDRRTQCRGTGLAKEIVAIDGGL